MGTLLELITKSPRGLTTNKILAIDPGETIGYTIIQEDQIYRLSEYKAETVAVGGRFIYELLAEYNPDIVVHEIYRIYKWRTDTHTWAPLFTPRLIGAIELACELRHVPLHGQTPQVAKNFCTDANLKAWGVYNAGSPHARDSLRHAIYFSLFGTADNK